MVTPVLKDPPARQDIAAAGRQLLYQFGGIGLAFIGTTRKEVVYATYAATGASTSDDTLYELLLQRALHAKYAARPSWPPVYSKWPGRPEPDRINTGHSRWPDSFAAGLGIR